VPLSVENAIAGPAAQSSLPNFFTRASNAANGGNGLTGLGDSEPSSVAGSEVDRSSADSPASPPSSSPPVAAPKSGNRSAASGANGANSANSRSVFNSMLSALLPAPTVQVQEPASSSASVPATGKNSDETPQSTGAGAAQTGFVFPNAALQLTATILPVSLPQSGTTEIQPGSVSGSSSQNVLSSSSIASAASASSAARIASSAFSGTYSGSALSVSSLANFGNSGTTGIASLTTENTGSSQGAAISAATPTNPAAGAGQSSADPMDGDPTPLGQSPAALAVSVYAGSASADAAPKSGSLNPSDLFPAPQIAAKQSPVASSLTADPGPADPTPADPTPSNGASPISPAAAAGSNAASGQIPSAAIAATQMLPSVTQAGEISTTTTQSRATGKAQTSAATRSASSPAVARPKPATANETADLAPMDTNGLTSSSDLQPSDGAMIVAIHTPTNHTSSNSAPVPPDASPSGDPVPNPQAVNGQKNNPATSSAASSFSVASPLLNTSNGIDSSSTSTDGNGPDASMRKASSATSDAAALTQAITQPVSPQSSTAAAPTGGLALSSAPQAAAPSKTTDAPAAASAPPLPSTNETTTGSPAAGTGPVQMAQMIDKASQSEMRIGLNTTAFGSVEVHAVVHANDVGISIGTERGDLHGLLAQELPGIAHNLQQENLRLGQVNIHHGLAFSNGMTSGGNSQSRSFTPKPPSMANVPDAVTDEAGVESAEPVGAGAAHYSDGGFSILA
jgi:hypothetical protein